MKPKLTDKWQDKYFKIDNYHYEYANGVRLVVSVNPTSNDFDYSVVINGGSYYEKQLNVPPGTAHFLEHLMAGSPNDLCKTQVELSEYAFGNRRKAGFSKNASTTLKALYFYAHGNNNAAERMIKYTNARVVFPLETIPNYIERERKIIANEIHYKPKEERDSGLQFDRFFWGDLYPELTSRVVGTLDSVAQITNEDLIKYYDAVVRPENIVITIQSPTKLTKSQQELVDQFVSRVPNHKSTLSRKIIEYAPGFKYGYFNDPDMEGIHFSISYYSKIIYDLDYKYDRVLGLLRRLIDKIGYDYLRLEKELVYSAESFNNREMIDYTARGVIIKTSKENLLQVLDETYNMLFTYIDQFLDSPSGKRWLENQISGYVYKRNDDFDEDYAEKIGFMLQDAVMDYKFDYTKAKSTMLRIVTTDIKNFAHEFFSKVPNFWFNSPYSQEEIEEIFKNSKFFKKFGT